jgi:hypothetical protein
MNKIFIGLSLACICTFVSFCSNSSDSNIMRLSAELKPVADCLLKHHRLIFTLRDSMSSEEVYNKDMLHNHLCNEEITKVTTASVAIITLYRDSTIFFYFNVSNSFPSKQRILVYSNTELKVNEKITSDVEFIKKLDKDWYQFERIISIAN